MSRIDDIFDLVQTANEAYLMNPSRNIRSTYIQIDDLCELAMKSYLQANVKDWTPISHQHDGRDYYKGFRKITEEIKREQPANPKLNDLLQRIRERRDNRNHFFHDQNQTGLTVDEQNCLLAFHDIYLLMYCLFQREFIERLNAKPVIHAQIAVIRLRLRSYQARVAYENYMDVLNRNGNLTLKPNSFGYEFCALYDDADTFLRRIQQHFRDRIEERESEINRINNLKKLNRSHKKLLIRLKEEIALFQNIIDSCLI